MERFIEWSNVVFGVGQGVLGAGKHEEDQGGYGGGEGLGIGMGGDDEEDRYSVEG